ncbi:MAG: hypothetical protein IT262_20365 [Saprospiraceae bacterium]|nr:hypothetical protein [Saprospiraceae bacterium]
MELNKKAKLQQAQCRECRWTHATGHFVYAGTLFRQFLAIYHAGTAFRRTGFHPSEKMSSSVRLMPPCSKRFKGNHSAM